MLHSLDAGYDYKINLNKIDGDALVVELTFTGHLTDSSHFCLPKIIPGIYSALDYGKFVANLKAFDESGEALHANRIDTNCWEISGAKNVVTSNYSVNDGWENFTFQGIRPCRSSESHFDTSVAMNSSIP